MFGILGRFFRRPVPTVLADDRFLPQPATEQKPEAEKTA
jgi:hypothetical protein